jgi:cystathionine beta-lyase
MKNQINSSMDRRIFIKTAGLTAIVGATSVIGTSPRMVYGLDDAEATSANGLTRMASNKFDFDTPYNLIGTNDSRSDSPRVSYPSGNLRWGMGVATMDFKAPPCIVEALEERLKNPVFGYVSNTDSIKEAIVEWNGSRRNLDIDPKSITVSSGVYPGMIAALRSFSPAGSKVLTLTPAYDGFQTICRAAKVELSESKMIFQNNRYSIDWSDLESKMTPDTRSFILCNPHNPTGNVWDSDDLLRIGRMCLERNIIVLSDEIWSDIVRPGYTFVPFESLPDKAVVNNSVTFNAASKTFNLAGMKVAYFYSKNPALLARVNEYHRAELNTLGIIANEAAMREGADWFDQALAYLDENQRYAESYIKENIPLLKYHNAGGTYLSWLDVSQVMEKIGASEIATALSKRSPEHYFQDWLVENSGVYLNAGSNYGAGGEGRMRMNLASSRLVLRDVFDAMSSAINKV